MFGLEFFAAKKAVIAATASLAGVASMLAVVTIVAVTSTTAAHACVVVAPEVDHGHSDDEMHGPIGGPVRGRIILTHANFINRPVKAEFNDSLRLATAAEPDFITLTGVATRTLQEIRRAAPGYGAYRSEERDSTPGGGEALSNVIAWREDTWDIRTKGRVQIVDADTGYQDGTPYTRSRYATWALFQRHEDGAVVAVVAAQHMSNPARHPRQHGSPDRTRAEMYAAGMDRLLALRDSLARHGPVLIGADLGTPDTDAFHDKSWSAVTKMAAAGYSWASRGTDFALYPDRVTLRRSDTGTLPEKNRWITVRLAMRGVEPEPPADPVDDSVTPSPSSAPAAVPADPPAVMSRLQQMRLREDYPALTRDQAENLVAIASVSTELQIPHRGLVIAIATAIQESKLVNLSGGDRDSAGLFQQRPSTGWGTHAQVTDPVLATRAFYGRAGHTNNPGLLDISGWQTQPLTQAAQAVQRSGHPTLYAQWETISAQLADVLAGTPAAAAESGVDPDCDAENPNVEPVTLATLHLRNTDVSLPQVLRLLHRHGAGIAALQGVRPPHHAALAGDRAWGMYPHNQSQNKVIWDASRWQLDRSRLVTIAQADGEAEMPLVQLRSTSTGQRIWVFGIHNRSHDPAALKQQHQILSGLKPGGTPIVALGSFNDTAAGAGASHCRLTPLLENALGGSANPCRPPSRATGGNHIYGANLTWASSAVDPIPEQNQLSTHPLVLATSAGSAADCAAGESHYDLGPVQPHLARAVNVLGPKFGITTVGGYREHARDMGGHPAGLAADFMVPLTPEGKRRGDALAEYARQHARQLGIDYIIWYQRIWSVGRAAEGWRPMASRGSDSADHRDHVHLNVLPHPPTTADQTASCGTVSLPVPVRYAHTDRRNWGNTGPYWSTWHTGTDFSVPCGTPILAAHAGTVTVEHHAWSGPLVKVSTGPTSLTTWYAHMQTVTVTTGQQVAAGQMIGRAGSEGNSSGCHLHFEVHEKNGGMYGPDNVDPSAWLDTHLTPIAG